MMPGPKSHTERNHMRAALVLFAVVLLHGTAWAQEKTLPAITLDVLAIIEAYNACAAEQACGEDDARGLQDDAKKSLADFADLIAAGSLRRISISPDQAQSIAERAQDIRKRIVQIEMFDAACNRAIFFIQILTNRILSFLGILWVAILYMAAEIGLPLAVAAYVAIAVPILLVSIPVVLGLFIFLAPCLFWWL